MSEEPLHVGRRYALKHTTRTVRATVQEIIDRTDPETLETPAGADLAGTQRHRSGHGCARARPCSPTPTR